ncbi:diuretic hormone receptor isoform X2 [Diachasmimorpha longicaudata]|uniref:diuretic hormone receptor isoform X2 n=1 Tax=Diachasmimorpha longicaudata TaxID=58733 RepID=UPI0030B88771
MVGNLSNEINDFADNYIFNTLNHIEDLNNSLLIKALECFETKNSYQLDRGVSESVCEVDWDSLLCWPASPPGTLVKQSCFEELHGVPYDSSQNASRWCWLNGTWDEYTNYSQCQELKINIIESGVEITTTLYFVGYTLSLSTLIVAVAIFLYFKELKCLRNNIHTNLMFTYMLTDLMWILATGMQASMQTDMSTCVVLFALLHYFHLTSFFWMFLEGLYLYLLVVKTFSGDNIKLRMCLFIGWGAPSLVVIVWGIAKSLTTTVDQSFQNVALYKHCPWMVNNAYDLLYQVPAITVLVINVGFLFMIMWVLITKLRSTTSAETQQYRKATKALLVLIPLLGITYVLVLTGPTEGPMADLFAYVRAALLSSQGLSVALFYCFLNSEVQNTVSHHLSRWKTARSIGTNRKYKNWSPRSRTESLSLSAKFPGSHNKQTHMAKGNPL